MSKHDDDRLLRDLFAALREDDRRALPPFDRVLMRASDPPRATDPPRVADRRRAPRWIWATAACLAAVLVTAVIQIRVRHQAGDDRLGEALALARDMDAWEAPTDAVLEISLLRIPDSVPTLEFTSVALPAMSGPVTATESGPATAPAGGTPDGGEPKPGEPSFPLL